MFLLLLILTTSCKKKEAPQSSVNLAPQVKNTIQDKRAAVLATSMLNAMGGQEKWDSLNYVSWTFFGARHLVWDKKGGRVRIDSPRDTSIYLVDLNNLKGKVIKGGKEVTDPEELTNLLERGKSIWINDSYWLFMPFKLWDSGVNVIYMREDTMVGGMPASVLALTFNEVGDTPENKYEIYLDKKDNLIKQWAFFKDAHQKTPSKIWPWDNYKSHYGLLLSSERSDNGGPSDVRVYDELNDAVFESFEKFDY